MRKLSEEDKEYMDKCHRALALSTGIINGLNELASRGMYIEWAFDDMTVLYGAQPKIGVTVADLSRSKGENILFRCMPGELTGQAILEQLQILIGVPDVPDASHVPHAEEGV